MNRTRVVIGGWSLIAATFLFAAVFTYLAAAFDYPDILDRPAREVLPRLLTLGGTGRAVWVLYAMVPLLLIPTGRGVEAAARSVAPRLGRVALWLAMLSAIAMVIGLARWPTLQWTLAESWNAVSPSSRDAMASTFDRANLYLGNVIGEFLGELFLNGFFLTATLALVAVRLRRWLLIAGVVASSLGFLAMLRNLTPLVASAAALNNIVLPLWMLTLGIALLSTRWE